MTYPQATNPIVIERVEPDRNRLTAGPFEFGIIVVNGEISDVFTEGYRTAPKSGMLGIGKRIDTRAYIAYASPFDLAFRLQDPNDRSATGGVPLDAPVLTSDGQIVAASIVLTLEVAPDRVENLLLLLGQRRRITSLEIAHRLKHEILAKALALNLNYYTASQLRGNRNLTMQMGQTLERELTSTISGFGLRLTNFHINWGLTAEESERIKQQRHASRIRDIERNQEMRRALPSSTEETILDRPPQPTRFPRQSPTAETILDSPPPPTRFSRPMQRGQQPARRTPPSKPAPPSPQGYCYVYTDLPARASRIHKSTCYYYKNRPPTRSDDKWWHGPYNSLRQAQSSQDTQPYARVCKICNP